MKKHEKELQQVFLDNEKAVLKELEKNYEDALDEINTRIAILRGRNDSTLQNVIYRIEHQKAMKRQIEAVLESLHTNEFETISEYLTKSYEDGFVGAMYSLYNQGIPLILPIDEEQVLDAIQNETKLSEGLYSALGKDTKKLSKQIASEISRGISNGASYSEIATNLASFAKIPKYNALRIARTEGHRIQCKASMDSCIKAKEKGADILRQWDAALDGDTRPTHRHLDGQIRELDEPFEANGFKVMYPGKFGRPEEDCNCRCAILQRARWALDEEELETLKERASYYGLDKSDEFEAYKRKYLKAAEKERVRLNAPKKNTKNTEKSGIIKTKWINDLEPRGQIPHVEEDELYNYVAESLAVSKEKASDYVDSVMAFTRDYFIDIRRYQNGLSLKMFDEDTIKTISDNVEEYIQVAPRWNGGETFRGWTVTDEQLESYKEGVIIKMGGTSSWTGTSDIATDFAERKVSEERPNSVVFHCDTQSKGTGISYLSSFDWEDEVLCSKESKYSVVKTNKGDDDIMHVYLKEVE